ncbi:hypothetical protein GCM10009525_13910 [Streptosporangium amethystogenes subsp. fukuiense]
MGLSAGPASTGGCGCAAPVLPGLRPEDGKPICSTCAGFKPCYRCSRRGEEGKLHARRLCTGCTLIDRLTELLDDGTGQIHPVKPSSRSYAGQQIIYATRFLTWLADRDLTLADCRQAHLDAWVTEHTADERNALRAFLRWSQRNKLARPPKLMPHTGRRAAPLTSKQRLALLREILIDQTGPPHARVAAILLLLYAQPVSRLVRLTYGLVRGSPDSADRPERRVVIAARTRGSWEQTISTPGSVLSWASRR